MHRYFIFIFVIGLLGCATPPKAESPYNKGVDAYRLKDYASARAHWTTAAASGNASAENNLGYLLFYGLGGAEDSETAIQLWRKAAEGGHSESQWHLGEAYRLGKAVPQSNVEAYAWYRCAVASAEAATGEDRRVEQEIANDARKTLEKLLGRFFVSFTVKFCSPGTIR